MVIAITQQPGFPDWPVARQRYFQPVRQTPPAPKPVLIDWCEAQRVERRSDHHILTAWRQTATAPRAATRAPYRGPTGMGTDGRDCSQRKRPASADMP